MGSTAGQSERGALQPAAPPGRHHRRGWGRKRELRRWPCFGRAVAAVWTDQRRMAPPTYNVAMSSDGGGTFSEPRRVNDVEGDASAEERAASTHGQVSGAKSSPRTDNGVLVEAKRRVLARRRRDAIRDGELGG